LDKIDYYESYTSMRRLFTKESEADLPVVNKKSCQVTLYIYVRLFAATSRRANGSYRADHFEEGNRPEWKKLS